MAQTPAHRTSVPLLLVRHILPAIVVLAGILIFIVNPTTGNAEGSAGIVGAGLAWWLFGWLFRKGLEGDRDRDDEDAARAYFDDHGYWPDEAPDRRV